MVCGAFLRGAAVDQPDAVRVRALAALGNLVGAAVGEYGTNVARAIRWICMYIDRSLN